MLDVIVVSSALPVIMLYTVGSAGTQWDVHKLCHLLPRASETRVRLPRAQRWLIKRTASPKANDNEILCGIYMWGELQEQFPLAGNTLEFPVRAELSAVIGRSPSQAGSQAVCTRYWYSDGVLCEPHESEVSGDHRHE